MPSTCRDICAALADRKQDAAELAATIEEHFEGLM